MTTLLLLVCGLFFLAAGEKLSGTINIGDDDGFSFLGKFCFGYTHSLDEVSGWLTINIANDKTADTNDYLLLFYDDQSNSWPAVYNSDKTCAEKISESAEHYRWRQWINFKTISDDSDSNTFFDTVPIHEHIRPRWWWVYLANCTSSTDVIFGDMSYDLHFEQENSDGWSREFGMNEKHANTLYLVYLVIYIGLVVAQVYAYFVYRIQQYIHQVIKLLTATIVLQMFGIFFNFIDWMIFMETGEHELFFPIIAALCEIFASSVFLLLLLVLAQGWTISRFEVLFPRTLLLGVIITCIAQCVFYIWRLIGLNVEDTKYFYNSLPMYFYGIFMIVIGVAFEVFCVWSYARESFATKRNLYLSISTIFSVWFLWFLMRIFVGDAFNEWSRDIAITAISETISTLAYLVMILLLWPTWAHQYFNLSMADTQVKILGADDTNGINSGTLDYQVLDHERL